MPYFDASDGCSLYYEDFGTGRPIVFVHGGGADHGIWDRQVAALADRHRTVCYDLRGVGRSATQPSDFTVERAAADLGELVDALGLHDGVVVTHGFGGHITLRAFRDRPDLTAGLVLVAAAPWFQGGPTDGSDHVGGFSPELTERITAGMTQSRAEAHWYLSDNFYYAEPSPMWTKIEDVVGALQWPSYVHKKLLESLAGVDHTEYLPTIAASTLLVHGRHDRKNRFEGAAVLEQRIPHAKLVVFEHSAHSPFAEEPERFNSTVAEFVESL